jgi:nucleoside-diphosphate-sugar epimerase
LLLYNKKMKILVTGATGFIGNYVVQELLKNYCEVIATSLNEEKAKAASWFSQVTYIPFNLKEFDESTNYYSFFGEPDAMIHLAWEGLPNYKDAFHVEENLPRHLAFLTNLINNGLTNLTVTGTCFEYGMKEGCLNEEMHCEPANPYAIAKNELRIQLEQLKANKSFNFKWIRLFYMYGQGQSVKSLISQLETALDNNEPAFNMSGGEQVRDFLPVEKVAANIVTIALQNSVQDIINCCSGKPVTVKAFVEDYLKGRNKSIKLNLGFYPYTDYEPMKFWGDNSKLKLIKSDD